MSVRTDKVALIVDVNGNTGLNNLNELKKKAADLRTEMQGLKKNTQEYKDKAAELKQVTADMDALKKQIGITSLSQKELVAELNKLKALRGSVVPFSAEFKELDKQVKAVENRLYDVRNGVQGFSSFFSKISDQVKQFGVVAAGYLGFQFITSQFQNILKGAGKLSDQLADLQRVAGLTAAEAQNLNKQLSAIDTRTTTSGLREIAIIAGKLGVAKDDIFDFTKAVDQLVVALGDELGDAGAITDKLGKILNVFDGQVTGDNISRLGNAFVELANTGASSGSFIADFDQRLAGIAQSSNISLGALSGLGAGIEELGGRVESSSTAIQKLIISIAQDIPKAAKIAGIDVAEFNKLFADDPTEALLKYSQGLIKNKESFSEVTAAFKDAGEEGARTIETITKLGTSADYLRTRIDLGKKSIQDNSSIIEAFRLKNETLGATLDKIGKAFNAFVSSSALNSALKSLAQGFLDLITPAKSAVQQFEDLSKKVSKLDSDIVPLLDRYEELKSKTFRSKEEQIELNKIINTIATTIPGAVTQFDNYGNAIAISTTRVKEFIEAEKARLKVVNAKAIDEYNEKLAETNEQLKVYKFRIDQIASTGTFITGGASGGTGGGAGFTSTATPREVAEAQAKYKQLLELQKGYNAEIRRLNGEAIDDQKKLVEETKKTTTATVITSSLEETKKAQKEAAEKAAADRKKRDEERKKLLDDAQKFYDNLKEIRDNAYTQTLPKEQQEIIAINEKYKKLLDSAQEFHDKLLKFGVDNSKQLASEEILIEKAKFLELNELSKKNLDARNKALESLNDANYKAAIESQRNNNAQLINQYKQLYADGIIDKKDYEEKIAEAAKTGRQNEIAVAEKWAGKSKLAAKDVADFKKKLEEEGLDAAIKALEEKAKAEEKANEDSIKRQQQLIENIQDFADTAVEYAQAALNIISAFDQIATNKENAAFNREKKQNEERKNSFKKLLDAKLISQEQYNLRVQKADEELDRKERALRRKQAERERQVNLYQALINTFSAVAEALPNIPLSIAAGIAGLAQVAAIESQDLPELGLGDWIRKGLTHKEGGINANIEKDEAVMSAKAMTNNEVVTVTGTTAQITSALNNMAGGRAWAPGAVVQMPDWWNRQPIGINSNMARIMKAGGLIDVGPLPAKQSVNRLSTAANDATADIQMAMLEELRSNTQAIKELKLQVSIKEIRKKEAEYDAAKKQSA